MHELAFHILRIRKDYAFPAMTTLVASGDVSTTFTKSTWLGGGFAQSVFY
jgi:hypothetical protein